MIIDVLKWLFVVMTSIRVCVIIGFCILEASHMYLRRLDKWVVLRNWLLFRRKYMESRDCYPPFVQDVLDSVFRVSEVEMKLLRSDTGFTITKAYVGEVLNSDFAKALYAMSEQGVCFGCPRCGHKENHQQPQSMTRERIIQEAMCRSEPWALEEVFSRTSDPQEVTSELVSVCEGEDISFTIRDIYRPSHHDAMFLLFVQYRCRSERRSGCRKYAVVYMLKSNQLVHFPPEPAKMQPRSTLSSVRTLNAQMKTNMGRYDITTLVRELEGPLCDFRCGKASTSQNGISIRFAVLCLVEANQLHNVDHKETTEEEQFIFYLSELTHSTISIRGTRGYDATC